MIDPKIKVVRSSMQMGNDIIFYHPTGEVQYCKKLESFILNHLASGLMTYHFRTYEFHPLVLRLSAKARALQHAPP
jgi:hypothetical protein